MNDARDERTQQLIEACRTADQYRARLDRRWPWVYAAMGLVGAAAVAALMFSHSDAIPFVLSLAALAIGGDHVLRNIRSDHDFDDVWIVLAAHTGLDDDALEQLVNSAGNSGTEAGDDQ